MQIFIFLSVFVYLFFVCCAELVFFYVGINAFLCYIFGFLIVAIYFILKREIKK